MNPRFHSSAFEGNLRSVRNEIVEVVMRHFFSQHPVVVPKKNKFTTLNKSEKTLEDIQCEEAILEAFGK